MIKNDVRPKNLTWLEEYDKCLREQKFFGKIILTYQNGKIIDVYKGEKIKPFKIIK